MSDSEQEKRTKKVTISAGNREVNLSELHQIYDQIIIEQIPKRQNAIIDRKNRKNNHRIGK